MIDTASTADFSALVRDVHMNRHEKDVMHKAALQAPLCNLTIPSPSWTVWLSLAKTEKYYSLYTNTLKKGYTPWDAFNWNFFSINDITWLPIRSSPFIKNNQIICSSSHFSGSLYALSPYLPKSREYGYLHCPFA